jgi:dUTP pyrophosphatase
MSKQIELVEELFDELHELAVWEGCETGDLCHSLMDIWEGYSSYMSLELQKSLEKEIRSLYVTLKEQKEEEDFEESLILEPTTINGPVVKIKLIHPDAKGPFRHHDNDACYDCVAVGKTDMGNGIIKYDLGFALEIPENTQVDFRPRSSVYKTGLSLSNCIVTGDEGYRGEYKVVFYHVLPHLPAYEIGDRIVQMQIRTREDCVFEIVEEMSDSSRATGGFGSTGK